MRSRLLVVPGKSIAIRAGFSIAYALASGGVSSLEDVKDLLPLQASGVIGVIIGKALYSGTLDLKAALDLALQANTKVE